MRDTHKSSSCIDNWTHLLTLHDGDRPGCISPSFSWEAVGMPPLRHRLSQRVSWIALVTAAVLLALSLGADGWSLEPGSCSSDFCGAGDDLHCPMPCGQVNSWVNIIPRGRTPQARAYHAATGIPQVMNHRPYNCNR